MLAGNSQGFKVTGNLSYFMFDIVVNPTIVRMACVAIEQELALQY